MKTDIQTLKDSFQMGYDAQYESRLESEEVWNLYHNRQWSDEQKAKLKSRGQPQETFNVIKLFARMLIGYYSTVMNSVRAEPVQAEDQTIASLMSDTVISVFEHNRMDDEGDKIKLNALISGLMVGRVDPIYSGKRDEFNRPIYDIKIRHVYDYEVVLDPMSKDDNYEDGRFLHRFKWLPEERIRSIWGEAKLQELTEYYNFLNVEEAEFEYSHGDQFQGRYKVFDNFLVVHTVVEDDAGKRWSIFWSGEIELERQEITFKEVKWNYRVSRLHSSNKTEYYGIFREVIESQKAINQALIKIQLMVNTEKIIIEKRAIVDGGSVEDFEDAVNRVNGVIPVASLQGIDIRSLSKEALEQYAVIDKAFDRIQRLLSINDSFLGLAFASDSGRKVKLQQNATIMALRYLTVRIEAFYELLGKDVISLVKQYYTANRTLRITDEIVGNRFIQINKPLLIWQGRFDASGQPVKEPVFEQLFNPETGKPEVDEEGNLIFSPIPEEGSEFAFTELDIRVASTAFNDEDERTQLMLEQVMQGSIGQLLAQVNPTGFFNMASLLLRTFKTKYSPEVAKILSDTSMMLSQQGREQEASALAENIGSAGSSPKSQTLKLPQNTNEEL